MHSSCIFCLLFVEMFCQFLLAAILTILLTCQHSEKIQLVFLKRKLAKDCFLHFLKRISSQIVIKICLVLSKMIFFTMLLLSYKNNDSLKNFFGCFLKIFSTVSSCGSIKLFSFISNLSVPVLRISSVGFIKSDMLFSFSKIDLAPFTLNDFFFPSVTSGI